MSNRTKLPSDYHLPEEIWNLILLKLPIKSILICTAVCKSWNSLIKSASFISSHLNHSISDSNPLFFLRSTELNSNRKTNRFSLRLDDDDFTEHTSLNFPCRFRNSIAIRGCCNGLILVSDRFSLNLYLWNPNLRKLVMLPPRDFRLYSFGGLGFDSSTNDYKALVISINWPREISLFSLNSNSWLWSKLDAFKQSKTEYYSSCGGKSAESMTFLNGNFHLPAQSNLGRLFVLAFDMYDGACSEMMLPSGSNRYNSNRYSSFGSNVNVYVGLLSVFLSVYDESMFYEIWVMKEYGVEESWTQTAKFTWPEMRVGFHFQHSIILSFRENGDAIMDVDGHIVLYNIGDKVTKDVKIEGEEQLFFVGSYVESLVLMDRGDCLRGEWLPDSNGI